MSLQSTPPQNWILLSVYQNRSGSPYQELCYTGVLVTISGIVLLYLTKP